MMKTVRLSALLLSALLLFVSIGCAAPAEQTAAAPAETTAPVQTEPIQAEPEETATPMPTATPEPEQPKETTIDIENAVVMDDETMRVTVKELCPDAADGYEIRAEIENRTEDTWSVSIAFLAVNGLMVEVGEGCEVAGKETRLHGFLIPQEELAAYDISDVTDLVLTFNMSNSTAQPTLNVTEGANGMPLLSGTDANALLDWFLNGNFHYGPVHICPYGEEKAVLHVREPQADDRVLYESEMGRVTMFGGAFDENGGYSMQFYLENLNPLSEDSSKRRSDLIFSVFNPQINGIQIVNNIVSVNVEQRSGAYLTASWTAEELAAAGIQKIKTLDVLLDIRDTEVGTVLINEMIQVLP